MTVLVSNGGDSNLIVASVTGKTHSINASDINHIYIGSALFDHLGQLSGPVSHVVVIHTNSTFRLSSGEYLHHGYVAATCVSKHEAMRDLNKITKIISEAKKEGIAQKEFRKKYINERIMNIEIE